MADPQIGYCKPMPVYVIIEQIGSAGGMPSILNTVGPQLRKVVRRVMQVCAEENAYYGGQQIKGSPTLFQFLDDYLHHGSRISMKTTGKKELLLVYAGTRNLLKPLPEMGSLLPKVMTKEYDLGTIPIMHYGSDPIPNQRLFGNPAMDFAMLGGTGNPTAVATYDATTNTLKQPLVTERQQAIQNLLHSVK